MKVVIGIDLGTTGNRVVAFTRDGNVAAQAYHEFPQIYPQPGWVEQDPRAIWRTTRRALRSVVATVGRANVVAIGMANQRETVVLWDPATGIPYYNAIVWQCRRTAGACRKLARHAPAVRAATGLPIDPYFSATKIRWIVDQVPGLRARIRQNRVLCGTIDAWILWKLTAGRVHATDVSNAARTLLFNIHTLRYDDKLLNIFGIPAAILPEVRSSGGDFGMTDAAAAGVAAPVTGILGDQQAALFAQGGWQDGVVKNTYGTGLFLMAATAAPVKNPGRLISTVAWQMEGKTRYAVEGSVFVGGACIQWLRDGLKIIASAGETDALARTLQSNDGVYFVPALTGLGAPYWDPDARGLIIGLTRGTTGAHLARAALEGIAYQVQDVLSAMSAVTGRRFRRLRVDGGAAHNNFLLQFQADISGIPVERPAQVETTVWGAAAMAGITAGFWKTRDIRAQCRQGALFVPHLKARERQILMEQWHDAVRRARGWAPRRNQ
jgi:glycerol kinase